MKQGKLEQIKNLMQYECEKEGKILFWKQLKEHYLTLKTEEEKNKVLSMIFRDK